jgi:hypothetical protein
MVVRWTLQDLSTLETYQFPVNPREDDTPGWEKNFQYTNTSAPDGRVIVTEGRDNVRRGGFSGIIYTEGQYNALYSWWDKRNQLQLTDDLGRSHKIILESFRAKRKRSFQHPWRHDYEVTYVIVDWP